MGSRRPRTDAQWLEDQFEDEVCTECGWDADMHTVGPDMFGLRHAWCDDPIPDDLDDDAYEAELAHRLRISTGR